MSQFSLSALLNSRVRAFAVVYGGDATIGMGRKGMSSFFGKICCENKAAHFFNYLKTFRMFFLICTFFIAHDAHAERKWDGKSPYWVAGVCGKLEFLAWDKFNMHPPYKVKYIVKYAIYTYTAEKLSSNKGTAFHAIFPDDFVDGSGQAARLSTSCITDKMRYEIYGDGARIEAGEVDVEYKIHK